MRVGKALENVSSKQEDDSNGSLLQPLGHHFDFGAPRTTVSRHDGWSRKWVDLLEPEC